MENEFFASINEVSKRLSIPAHTLRYWEKQFPVAIRPTTGTGGRRYYRAETIERLIIIRELLYRHGMTIAGVKKLLHDGKFPNNVDEINVIGAVSTDTSTPVASVSTNNSPAINTAIDLLTQARALLG